MNKRIVFRKSLCSGLLWGTFVLVIGLLIYASMVYFIGLPISPVGIDITMAIASVTGGILTAKGQRKKLIRSLPGGMTPWLLLLVCGLLWNGDGPIAIKEVICSGAVSVLCCITAAAISSRFGTESGKHRKHNSRLQKHDSR